MLMVRSCKKEKTSRPQVPLSEAGTTFRPAERSGAAKSKQETESK